MPIAVTALHRSVGMGAEADEREVLAAAIQSRVAERADLDWKEALPPDKRVIPDPKALEAKLDEYAKDVAAMANSGGGVIVYGVREAGGDADELVPVDVSEDARSRLRALAFQRIDPPVAGLQLVPIPEEESAAAGALMVIIPPSAEAPHAVPRDGRLGFPYRDGPHTRWMSQRDAARAYRDQFTRLQSERERLDTLAEEVAEGVDLLEGPWLIATAAARVPTASLAPPPDAGVVARTLAAAQERRFGGVPPAHRERELYHPIAQLGSGMHDPRIGLRRWIAGEPTIASGQRKSRYVHVELLHDGSSALAMMSTNWRGAAIPAPDGSGGQAYTEIRLSMVEDLAVSAIALAVEWARATGVASPIAVQIGVVRNEELKPYALVVPTMLGAVRLDERVPEQSRILDRLRPAVTEVRPDATDDEILDAARVLAADILNQLGWEGLLLLAKADTSRRS